VPINLFADLEPHQRFPADPNLHPTKEGVETPKREEAAKPQSPEKKVPLEASD
jgi:hypothetical protein